MKNQKPLSTSERGFTLIEIMIVVAILGILSSVAYSSYSNFVTRSARGDAMEQLNEIMSQQQRFVLRQRTYTINLTTDLGYAVNADNNAEEVRTDNGLYDVSASVCAGGIALNRCVLLTATPVDDLRQDGDGALTLNSNGQKTQRGRVGWYQQN